MNNIEQRFNIVEEAIASIQTFCRTAQGDTISLSFENREYRVSEVAEKIIHTMVIHANDNQAVADRLEEFLDAPSLLLFGCVDRGEYKGKLFRLFTGENYNGNEILPADLLRNTDLIHIILMSENHRSWKYFQSPLDI